jgi:hypothetical protein
MPPRAGPPANSRSAKSHEPKRLPLQNPRRPHHGVGEHLAPGAQIVIQENLRFSSRNTFRPMLDRNNLRLVGDPLCETPEGNTLYFYIWSTANLELA